MIKVTVEKNGIVVETKECNFFYGLAVNEETDGVFDLRNLLFGDYYPDAFPVFLSRSIEEAIKSLGPADFVAIRLILLGDLLKAKGKALQESFFKKSEQSEQEE